ncbi:polysaccharide biosynthesis/export family protein [Costertonia aggregata]|uniref:Polysaccharide biosynthesis/export family protein n=1 Tax=Costertonia aggregata TaxID=343403 RepID=A0A7H9AM81_9FLAO|nr:polysaccharide biosynthesis/export family protein [Costertonia aggregata]QLG44570.1 polysaccharide biosynthesis/export family protein [Costertonia aggregata]
MNKNIFISAFVVMILQSCASKKDVLYFQDAEAHSVENIIYNSSKIQPNDILSIVVGASVPETTYPYNVQSSAAGVNLNLDVLQLQGYLVSNEGFIDFPVLGKIKVLGETIDDLEIALQKRLEKGGHLIDPTVSVRILNAKVTVLGEVKVPGTYTFTEQNISLPQALGYAGDLTINGERKDILIIREESGVRNIARIDLTTADWFGSPYYYIKPNDVIVVNPNNPKVKSAGFIGNAGTVLTIASLILTSVVLITR